MPEFRYEAINQGGQHVDGTLMAGSRAEALRLLSRQALQPIKLFDQDAPAADPARKLSAARPGTERKLKSSEILYFTEDLADLLDAGMQLEPALAVMEKRQTSIRIRSLAAALRNQVREGGNFSRALRTTGGGFDDLYCNMVEAGELSGSLAEILRRQALYLSSIADLQNKVTAALIYPSFLMAAGGALIVIFITVLIPRLTSLFQQTGGDLPLVTRVLVWFSDLLVYNWYIWTSMVIGAVIAFFAWTNTPEGKKSWHRLQLRIPLFGPVLQQRSHTRIAHTLGALILNGIPLLKGLQLMNRANPNLHIQEKFRGVINYVEQGANLSTALRKADALPGTTIDIVSVGEQTGNLGGALVKIAARQEKELTQSILRLTSMLQPTVIIVLAFVLGLVAYSIFTGILKAITGLRVG